MDFLASTGPRACPDTTHSKGEPRDQTRRVDGIGFIPNDDAILSASSAPLNGWKTNEENWEPSHGATMSL